MKNLLKATLIIAWMVIISNITYAQNVSVNFQTFYQELSPYGTWMSYADYGNVWIPNAGPDFRPYATDGYWAVTEYGNTWVSDYAWGWAPFHYGRWLFDDFYGWLWIPGSEWAPAWVAWRSGDGYYGWAPLAPRVNINIAFNIPNHHWYFVPQQHLCGPGLARYFVNRTHVVTICHNTTIVNNIHQEYNSHCYFTGPSRYEIEARRGRAVEIYSMNRCERPGTTVIHDRTISMYRPSFDSRHDDGYNHRGRDRNNNNSYPERNNNNNTRDHYPERNDHSNTYGRHDNGRNNTMGRVDNQDTRPAQQPRMEERNQPAPRQNSVPNVDRFEQRQNESFNRGDASRQSNQTNGRREVLKPAPEQNNQFQQHEGRQQQGRQFSQPDFQRHVQHTANENTSSHDRSSGGRSRR